METKINKKIFYIIGGILVIGIIIFILLFLSPNKNLKNLDVSININYNSNVITITEKDLKKLKKYNKNFTMKLPTNKKVTNKYNVIKVQDLLESKNIKNYNKINFCGADDYCATFTEKEANNSYFALLKDGETMKNNTLKIVAPEKESKFWVGNIKNINIEQ